MNISDPSYELAGYLDLPAENEEIFYTVEIVGWAIPPNKIAFIEAIIDGKEAIRLTVDSMKRADLALAYPSVSNASSGGFRALITIGDGEGIHKVVVRAVTYSGRSLIVGERTIINSRSIVSGPPHRYHIGLVTRCNLYCRMCPIHSRGSRTARKGSTIEKSVLEACLNGLKEYASDIKHIGLTDYGEPLLYKEIFSVIADVHQICPSTPIFLATNGTLLNKEMINNILDSSLTDLCISLDAGTKKTYEKIRKGANFGHVLDNIRMLIKMRNEREQVIPHIWTNFVLMKSNIHELLDYTSICADLGVDCIGMVNPHGLFEADKREVLYHLPNEKIEPDLQIYEKIINDARAIALKGKQEFTAPNISPRRPGIDCSVAGRTRPFPVVSGDVYPCCVLAALGSGNSGVKPMGNLKRNSLKDIWESDIYKQFREAFFRGEIPSSICAKCPKYYHM